MSISVNPLLYRLVGPADAVGRPPAAAVRGGWPPAAAARHAGAALPGGRRRPPRIRAVVVGYGPVGRTLCRLLRENGIEPTVIEMNLETVQRLRTEGATAVYGDAGRPETLERGGGRPGSRAGASARRA